MIQDCPAPDLAAALLNQSHIPELSPGRGHGLLARQARRHEFFCFLTEMLLDLLPEIAVNSATEKGHGSPGERTRVMPSSMRSKLDISRSRCLAPAAVSL